MESTAFDIMTSGKMGSISTFLTEEQPVKNKAAIAINEYFFIGIVKIMTICSLFVYFTISSNSTSNTRVEKGGISGVPCAPYARL